MRGRESTHTRACEREEGRRIRKNKHRDRDVQREREREREGRGERERGWERGGRRGSKKRVSENRCK